MCIYPCCLSNAHRKTLLYVGASYGRKVMTGYINSKGRRLSRRQVRESLKRVNPVDHNQRVRRQHPVPYNAPYYGNKLHCDQNEKLCMYGCTLYALTDRCSSKIVTMGCMPRKNSRIVYSYFRLVNSYILRLYLHLHVVTG